MKQIHRWELDVRDEQGIEAPVGTQWLTVALFEEAIVLYGLCPGGPREVPMQRVLVRMFGTGETIPAVTGEYRGTVQSVDGQLVMHVFVEVPASKAATPPARMPSK